VERITAERLSPIDLDGHARERLRDRARFRVTTERFGVRLEMAFEDESAAALHRHRYARFLSEAAEPQLRLRAVNDGELTNFFFEGGAAYRWHEPLNARGIGFLADALETTAFFTTLCPHLVFHAAALAIDNVAIAISAASESGKTTTALACARRGMSLYSDEWCVFDGRNVLPYPRALSVRRDGLALFSAERTGDPVTARAVALQADRTRNLAFEELFGEGAVPTPRPLAAIFFIAGRSDAPHVAPLDSASAVQSLLSAPLRSSRPRAARVAAAFEVLSSARAFSLTLGTPDATALAIAETARALRATERCA
jgi:hypothetical protein